MLFMKGNTILKRSLRFFAPVLSLLLAGSGVCSGKTVDEAAARRSAWEYLSGLEHRGRSLGVRVSSPASLELAHTVRAGEHPLYYVFNTTDGRGFVLAAAADCASPVLGYSDGGPFVADSIPCGLKALIECYERQIGQAVASGAGAYRRAVTTDDRREVSPLIATQWGQGAPYNALCPRYQGSATLTGCVATATAQLMYYHQWPRQGRGSISYDWRGRQMSCDFSQALFEWEKMKLRYSTTTPDPDHAVATLMYYCAMAATADFGPTLTYGYFDTQKLHLYFGYKDQIGWLDMAYSTPEEFDEVIYSNLERGLPVVYRAEDPQVWAHVFLVDGYRADGYYHMNLGWDGDADGYYKLTVVDTPYARMRSGQMMIYNIEPESVEDGIAPSALSYVAARGRYAYSLQGRRVGRTDAGTRLPRGIYIVDGRKMVCR